MDTAIKILVYVAWAACIFILISFGTTIAQYL